MERDKLCNDKEPSASIDQEPSIPAPEGFRSMLKESWPMLIFLAIIFLPRRFRH